jgi:hypothetical protein
MRRPVRDTGDWKLPARIFAVLAAVNLVGFVALATMVPDMSLFEAVHVVDAARRACAAAVAAGLVRAPFLGATLRWWRVFVQLSGLAAAYAATELTGFPGVFWGWRVVG